MEPTADPSWESGLPSVAINPLPESFITFFPCDSTTTTSQSSFTYEYRTPWSAFLIAPASHIRLPAWDRVAVQPQSSTSFRGLIRKRVGYASRLTTKTTPIISETPCADPLAYATAESKLEPARRKQRTEAYAPNPEEIHLSGFPMSSAETARVIMTAKVNVANNILSHASCTSFEDRKSYRDGTHIQTVPQKRRLHNHLGGNRVFTYANMMPILAKAEQNGLKEIDLTTASIAETSAIMQDIRRNPRKHIAIWGVPDLSDISDATEPESPTLIKAPVLKAEAKSPTKRLAKLTTPIKKGFNRLAQNFVKLPPIGGNKVSPSPTKSSSAPSTPVRGSLTPKLNGTPPAIGSSPLAASVHTVDEDVAPQPSSPGRTFRAPSYADSLSLSYQEASPGRTFRAPSYADSSSSSIKTFNQSPPAQQSSPIKYTRPVAPTPSRWNRPEPTTPQAFTPHPSTPSQSDSPIGLASLISLSTPKPPPCTFAAVAPSRNIDFSFGDVSPSFNSISWVQTSTEAHEPRRIKNLNKSRRRQSEPLFRKYVDQQARRQSMSPKKVSFQRNEPFRDRSSPSSLFVPAEPKNDVEVTQVETYGDQPAAATDEVASAETETQEAEAEMTGITTSSIAHVDSNHNLNVEIVAESVTEKTPTTQKHAAATTQSVNQHRFINKEHGVLNIDTRKYPDIFAAHMSPFKLCSPSIKQLAQIAEDRCAGQAKVVVAQENGKLVVRFKLPTKYAHMFPESQGFDESRFTTSPSAISSSPRISFQGPKVLLDRDDASVTSEDQGIHSSFASNHLEETPLSKGHKSFASPNISTKRISFSGIKQTDGETSSITLDSAATISSPSFTKPATEQNLSTTNAQRPSTSSPSKRASMVKTPEATHIGQSTSPMFTNLPASAKPLSPLEATPVSQDAANNTVQAVALNLNAKNDNQSSRQNNPKQPASADLPSMVADGTPAPAGGSTPTNHSDAASTPSSIEPLHNSFTPVNQPTPGNEVAAADSEETAIATKNNDDEEQPTPKAATTTPETQVDPATQANNRAQDYDSPGRDYIQKFINRSRPKRTIATETGSPVTSASSARQPLVAKSPNTASPQKGKGKRKLEAEGDQEHPPTRGSEEPAPKRTRRTTTSSKQNSQLEITMVDHPELDASSNIETTKETVTETAESQNEEDAGTNDVPATRSSTRLRSKAQSSTTPKSSIPTPIKIGGRSGSGARAMDSAKKDQQDLQAQTRKNTRRNKGNAEHPSRVLARHAGQGQQDDPTAEMEDAETSTTAKSSKKVVWKEPLESVQEQKREVGGEEPKKGRTAAKKPHTTLGKSGIAKPKTVSQARRTAKLAENLGMAGNGTPAKPQRVTRSRTRSQTGA